MGTWDRTLVIESGSPKRVRSLISLSAHTVQLSSGSAAGEGGFHSTNRNLFLLLLRPSQIPGACSPAGRSKGLIKRETNSLCEHSREKRGSSEGGGLSGKGQTMYPYGEQKEAGLLAFRKQAPLF